MKSSAKKKPGSKRVAIVGMSCLFPGAPDLASYWSNIVRGVDAIREVSDKEWEQSDYYDPESKTFGPSYSKRGGFITEHADFDPLKFGIMPSAVAGSDPDQFLTLKVALAAMTDAGYAGSGENKKLDVDRAEIILGRISAPGAGSMNLIQQSKTIQELGPILAAAMPEQSDETIAAIVQQIQGRLVNCTADNIPGTMPNILAGRIAAKLGFRGRSLLIDAACASSMIAVETAVNDLLDERCDFALAGGVHINSSALFFQMFCGLGALSRRDTIRPFDQDADGTLLGEGIGILCLKRFEDAISSGDKIYATICGVASSSDGHGGSVLAPSLEGEALAMQKAYDIAGFSPDTVELLEAHGTGTPVGDVVELEAVAKVFAAAETKEPWCAIGSVKSMIGHCQSASAVAGIIKTALALHHKILPATLNVKKPNTKINWAKHPCYVNSQTRPWIKAQDALVPRRAAVSAFGFGGVNGHLIMEEFAPPADSKKQPAIGDSADFAQESLMHVWDSEVFTFYDSSIEGLLQALSNLEKYLDKGGQKPLKDLAYTVNCALQKAVDAFDAKQKGYRLAIVSSSVEDLQNKLRHCQEVLPLRAQGHNQTLDKDVYFTTASEVLGGKLAFLYPGLGSAYTNMLADLCMHFPEVREVFEIVDRVALSAGATEAPSKSIFPAPFDKGLRAVPTLLGSADFAVVAVLLAEYSMYQLLIHLGIKPDVIMGCSTGEFAAITTTGSVDVLSAAKTFYQLSTKVARSIPAESLENLRTLRVLSSWKRVSALTAGDIYLSADLGDNHIIVTGSTEAIDALTINLKASRIGSHLLPVPIPYHTPLVASIIDANNEAVQAVDVQPLAIPGWSCSTGSLYPHDVEAMRSAFVELFTKPIALRQTIQAMYEDGVRTFVEVGPNGILTSSIAGILNREPHTAVASNLASRSGLTQIHHLLALLYTQAVPSNLAFLYKRRDPQVLDFAADNLTSTVPGKKLGLIHTALKIDGRSLPKIMRPAQNKTDHIDSYGYYDYEDYANYADRDNLEEGQDITEAEDGAVVESFLNTNATFYSRLSALSETLMQSYIQGADENNSWSGQVTDIPLPPFLRRAQISHKADGASEMTLKLDLATDLYLLDHAIGGAVSSIKNTRVHLVPLMVTLEIMAEAALAHVQYGVPVRVEAVKAYRRIVVDSQGLTLRAVARSSGDGVQVVLYDTGRAPGVNDIFAEARFVFAQDYYCAEPNVPQLSVTDSAAPKRLSRLEDLYGDGQLSMFHGPLMQSVLELAKIGNRSISGTAKATPASGWTHPIRQGENEDRSESNEENFLLHPLLLDNASQFVLFYLYEKALPATALLPFLIESVEFFNAPQYLPPVVSVAAVLPTLTERATEANLEVIADDQVILKINGINSRRVVLSEVWEKFVRNPIDTKFGTRISINDNLADSSVIVRVDKTILPEDEVILDWCLDYVLTPDEQAVWLDAVRTKKRKIDWLLGRIAAKEAVAALIQNQTGRALGPHDIEIESHASGAPSVRLADPALPAIMVSISHTDGVGVALATLGGTLSPGIDAEIIREREPSFASTFLKQHELSYLASCPQHKVNSELTRLWSAKEALYKASGGTIEMSSFALATDAPGADTIVMSGGAQDQKSNTYVSTTADLVIAYTLANLS